jgi:anti-sigma factor RsiW
VKARVACVDGVEMLMDYLEGTLGSEDREAIEAHVSGCLRCVAFVESYRQTPRILRAATAASLPEDLAESLRRFLAARRAGEDGAR